MTHTDKRLVVTMMTTERLVLDIAELPIPNSINLDNLVIETRITDDTPPRLKRDRSPLSPNALTINDLKVGMKIRVHYTGDCPWAHSYSAIVAGKPKKEERDVIIIPLFRLDTQRYYTGYAPDMGLTRYGWGSYSWSPVRYVTAE